MNRTRLVLVATAASAAAVAGTIAIAAGPSDASAPAASHAAASSSTSSHPVHHRHWYEVQAAFREDKKTGTIRFTSRDYSGVNTHHTKHYTATDHFVCVFGSGDTPTCDGEVAHDDSMLIVHGPGGQGSFRIRITGGTGRFSGAHGWLYVHDLDKNGDRSNIEATYRR